jgi:hypothetical protein
LTLPTCTHTFVRGAAFLVCFVQLTRSSTERGAKNYAAVGWKRPKREMETTWLALQFMKPAPIGRPD